MKKNYTHIIWDFNGTILDDIQLCINCVNVMLKKRSLPTLDSVEAYRRIMRFPVIDYYRDLGFDMKTEDYYEILAPEWVNLYLEGEESCGMMPGVLETLNAAKSAGITQIVLSATKTDQLKGQLERLGITEYFSEILGLDNFYAASKTQLAEIWRKAHPEAVVLSVGDTDHDAALADVLGADGFLYLGGHQSAVRLSACGKTLISEIPELMPYFE
ncbi:MAG: HAD family hydrolase [Ruminococcaceae bacterium]|nr:HAD family hydrolase [Oscillospiraceae bacterium]